MGDHEQTVESSRCADDAQARFSEDVKRCERMKDELNAPTARSGKISRAKDSAVRKVEYCDAQTKVLKFHIHLLHDELDLLSRHECFCVAINFTASTARDAKCDVTKHTTGLH